MSDNVSNGNGGMVPAESDESARLPLVASYKPFVKPNGVIFTGDTTTEAGFMMYMEMTQGETLDMDSALNQVIGLTDFYFTPKRKVNEETGEVVIYPRYVLRADDGKCYAGGANSIFGAIADLLLFRPHAPWNPPFRVRVGVKKLEGGKRVFTLMPVFEAKSSPPAAKGGKGNG